MKIIDQDICISGKHAPVGLYIGEFRHPLRGFLFPAIIPNTTGAVTFTYQATADISAMAHICEDLIAHFVQSLIAHEVPDENETQLVAYKVPDIYIIDKSLRNRFPNLMSLNFHKNIQRKSNDEQINKYIVTLCDEIRNRSYSFTDANTPDIYAYNEQGDARSEEKYILNIVNLNDYATSIERLTTLQEILIDAYALGVIFVFYFDPQAFERFLQQQKEDKAQAISDLLKEILSQTPTVEVKKGDLFLDKNNPYFDELNTFVAQNKLTIEVSTRNENMHILHNVVADIREKIEELNKNAPKPFLQIEVGRTPDGKQPCYFELGNRNQAYHAFMIGMNGTGKTTLLDHIIKGIAQQFTPDEAELYLFDYKEGVEFNKYGRENCYLPHVKLIMVDDTNIQAIGKVLERFQSQIEKRGNLFRSLGVKSIDRYNNEIDSSKKLKRSFLIIDEVQRLFEHKDYSKISNLLVDVAKRGRAFGLHMILSTQSLRGNLQLDAGLFAQFKMRISFKVDLNDGAKIFSIKNSDAPTSLGRFEFILNDDLGEPNANQRILMSEPLSDDIIEKIFIQYRDNEKYPQPEIIKREENKLGNDNTVQKEVEKINDDELNPSTYDMYGVTVSLSDNKTANDLPEIPDEFNPEKNNSAEEPKPLFK